MAFNVNNFRSNGLTGGGTRPTLFKVMLQRPAVLPDVSEKFTFTCFASEIPSARLGTVEVPYFGRTIKLAGDRTFDAWRVSIFNDEDFSVRDMFERWSNLINTFISNRLDSRSQAISGQSSYKTVAQVEQFAKAGPPGDAGVLRTYNFDGIFPVDVGSIRLAWDDTNQVEVFDVTFDYDWWVPIPRTTDGVSQTGKPDQFGLLSPE